MLTQKIEKTLNKQVNEEFYSAYLYLSMSAWFETINLKGFANWMNVQFQEEQFHALKIYNFILERGGKVVLTSLKGPKTSWKNAIEVFGEALAHEQKITGLVNNLTSLALAEKDHATAGFMQWFVDEQVEEEANADAMLQQLKLISGKGAGLFMMDKEAQARVFTPPAQA